jgi:hypothetical protein
VEQASLLFCTTSIVNIALSLQWMECHYAGLVYDHPSGPPLPLPTYKI